MFIYVSLIIPIVFAVFLYLKYKHEVTWWELIIPFAASLLFTFLSKLLIDHTTITFDEYHGSIVSRAEYYEPWNEYIKRTCTSRVGKTTVVYDCSYVQYHPAEYYAVTSTGERIEIPEQEYQRLKRIFHNVQFKELGRSYHTQDGDLYFSSWTGGDQNAIAATTTHTYQNKVKVADQSLFHFRQVDTAKIRLYGLFDYPEIHDYYRQDCLLGDSTNDTKRANHMLSLANGYLGQKKKVHAFVLVFKDQPMEAAFYQESYWQGGNMNEFIVCIGIDKNRNVKWSKVISWTTNELLKIRVRDYVQNQSKLKLTDIVRFTQKEIENAFIRRDEHEFDYLSVEPPLWATILTFVLTIAINFGISFWIVNNEHNPNSKKSSYYRRW
jgi:hypothetical protein